MSTLLEGDAQRVYVQEAPEIVERMPWCSWPAKLVLFQKVDHQKLDLQESQSHSEALLMSQAERNKQVVLIGIRVLHESVRIEGPSIVPSVGCHVSRVSK